MQELKTMSQINTLLAAFLITLSFSFCASADAIHGIFMVVKGDVSVSNSAKQKQKVKVGDKVSPGDVVESAAESRAKTVMSDRNVINISPDTKLEIQKYENDGKNKNVEMNLLQGKVRNNVEQKYDGEKNKFLIKTPTAVAGVRGTQFFTSFDPATKITAVVTLRGAVSLTPVKVTSGNLKPVIIQKGESTTVSPGSNPEPPKAMPKEDLKKIDQESTASASGMKQETPKDIAAGDSPKAENINTETKEARSPAMADVNTAGNPPSSKGPSMVEVNDMDAGQFKEIRMPAAIANQPAPPPPMLMNPTLPPPPPQGLINSIIGGNAGRARIIVKPIPQ